jgi:hypothetical protein
VHTPRNNIGAHVENIHVQSWRCMRKKGKKNISNKKMIRISI